MDTQEGLRLRLMALLSLYDLLPYSISNPPHGAAPLSLEDAIGPEALRRCLEAISRAHPSSLPAELANILRSCSQTNSSSGQRKSGNNRNANYSNRSTPSSQGQYVRSPY